MKYRLLIFSFIALILASIIPRINKNNASMTHDDLLQPQDTKAVIVQSTQSRIYQKLQKPGYLSAKRSGNSIILNWGSVDQAVGYTIYRRRLGTKEYSTIAYVSASSCSYVDRMIERRSRYLYKVVAKAQDSQFDSDAAILNDPVVVPLYSPTKVKGKEYGFYIKLSYGKVKQAVQYEIYRAKSANGTFHLIGKTTKCTYFDKSVKPNKKYYYKIKARHSKKNITYRSVFSKKIKVKAGRLDKNKPLIALTFDDGPSIYTPNILAALKEHNGRATFFVVGNRINRYKSQLKAIYEADCEIGNHSYSHANLGISSKQKIKSELSKCDKLIKKVTGKKPKLIRPPYGSINENLVSESKRPLVLWNVDTLDWQSRDADKVYNHVMSHLHDGNIILMHDVYRSSERAAIRIISALERKGYQMVTVSELALCRKQKLKAGKRYFNFSK